MKVQTGICTQPPTLGTITTKEQRINNPQCKFNVYTQKQYVSHNIPHLRHQYIRGATYQEVNGDISLVGESMGTLGDTLGGFTFLVPQTTRDSQMKLEPPTRYAEKK